MSNLVKHAKSEFKILGWDKTDDEMQQLICRNVIDLLKVVSGQGHSGSSLPYLVNLFDELVKFNPISPLTGADDEWVDVSGTKEELWQNKRDSEVFKNGSGDAHWINGRIFEDEDGSRWTNCDSQVEITFPWTKPESEIIKTGKQERY